MSERDLIKELKATITDLTADRDEALAKIKSLTHEQKEANSAKHSQVKLLCLQLQIQAQC